MGLVNRSLTLLGQKEFLNLLIRSVSIFSRFILIFFLGKYFSLEELGTYGLFYTSISLGILVIGLDFYNYSNRELIYVSDDQKIGILINQVLFHSIGYIIVLLPFTLLFQYEILPWKYLLIFYGILISDHLSQELYRIYTILSFPIFANILLFLRNGIWVLLLLIFFYGAGINKHSLDWVFKFWLGGSVSSVVVGCIHLFYTFRSKNKININFSWILKGIKVSGYYFISTLCLIGIEHVNRYFIEKWSGRSSVGIFTFYSQVANVINVFVYTLVIMFVFPHLVDAFNKKDEISFEIYKKELKKKVTYWSIAIGGILGIGIFPVLYIMGKPEYYENIYVYYILLVANLLLNISYIYHYVLYAQKNDVKIFVATIISAVISLLLNIILVSTYQVLGAAIALCLSYGVLASVKFYFSNRSVAITSLKAK